MELNDKTISKISILIVILLLGILTYLVIRPVLMATITALILAYLFVPLHTHLCNIVKNRTIAASIVVIVLLLVIIIPIWFLIPIVIPQVSEVLKFAQEIDIQTLIKSFFPTASDQFARQLGLAFDSFVSNIGHAGLEKLTQLLIELPLVGLQLFIICFVFFFVLRDNHKLREFVRALSPFTSSKEKIIIKSFKDITDSVIYGQIIIGLVQGALAGLGFIMFGIKGALVLTILATLLSIIPILGPYIVWVPISIYLFATGSTPVAVGYLLYNLLIVSTIDNILRSYMVSRRTKLSPAVIFIGMMGGFLVFGIIGILLGPLILAYFLIFLNSYRDRTINTIFSDGSSSEVKKE